MTSGELAACMNTNPVVVRRTMAGLREAGFVRSEKGHGGGWEIACDLEAVTLKDVYDALGAPTLMAMGIHLESPILPGRAGGQSVADRCLRRGRGAADRPSRHRHARSVGGGFSRGCRGASRSHRKGTY